VDIVAQAGWGAALAAFVAGLASFFSPCVAPLVPGYMSYLAGASLHVDAKNGTNGNAELALAPRGRANPAVPAALLFVAGFSATFIALGLLGASLGSWLLAYRLVLETVAGIVMVAMGAFLLNLLPRPLTELLQREGRLALRPGTLRLKGATPFVLGVVFAAGWTPCIGPVLASILLYVSASANLGQSVMLLGLYALGFALPFLAVGLGWSVGMGALGWVRRHGHAISVASGVALIVIGIVYLTGEVNIFSTWAQHLAVAPSR
jgi:cytochrome c-type biogenesis protein